MTLPYCRYRIVFPGDPPIVWLSGLLWQKSCNLEIGLFCVNYDVICVVNRLLNDYDELSIG